MSRSEHRSLRNRLLVAVMAPLFLLGVLAAASDLHVARRLTDEAYDQALARTAIGLAVRLETDADDDLSEHLDATMQAMARIDAPDTWRYLVRDARGTRLAGDARLSAYAAGTLVSAPQFGSARIAGEPMRLVRYRYEDVAGAVDVVVAVTLHGREAAVAASLRTTLWENGLLLFGSLAAVFAAVSLTMRAVDALGVRLSSSNAETLVPIPLLGVPREGLVLLRAVNGLMERLRNAARSKQRFLDHTAHQLRTPLASMQTQLDVMAALPTAQWRDGMNRLQTNVAALSHLTHQMLALARAEGSEGIAVHQPVDLVSVCEDVATAADDLARSLQVDLEFDVRPVAVLGVPWMLSELLGNLVHNAIQHAPAGSGVSVRCRPEGAASAVLEVLDAGPGIPEAERQRVFQPFVRLSADNRSGAGLGLAIVREVADRHGATVTMASSGNGRGTRARVVFPVTVRQHENPRGETSVDAPALASSAN